MNIKIFKSIFFRAWDLVVANHNAFLSRDSFFDDFCHKENLRHFFVSLARVFLFKISQNIHLKINEKREKRMNEWMKKKQLIHTDSVDKFILCFIDHIQSQTVLMSKFLSSFFESMLALLCMFAWMCECVSVCVYVCVN